MLEKFSQWWNLNSTPITWWIIGWLSMACVDSLGKGNYIVAAVDAGLAYWNYTMWRDRDV